MHAKPFNLATRNIHIRLLYARIIEIFQPCQLLYLMNLKRYTTRKFHFIRYFIHFIIKVVIHNHNFW